jgi:hypothetical protein
MGDRKKASSMREAAITTSYPSKVLSSIRISASSFWSEPGIEVTH